MPSLADLTTHSLRKVFIMGEPGTGKTVFAAGFPGKIKFFDFDGKIESAYGYLKRHDPAKLSQIDFENCVPIDDKGTTFVRMNEELARIRVAFQKGERPYETLVIDSSTIMADEMLKWLINFETGIKLNTGIRSRKVAVLQHFQIFSPTFASFLYEILGMPWNVVVTGHIAVKEDELTKEVHRHASIPGAMGKKIGIYFPEVYRSFAENGKYWAQTKADFRYPCRSQIQGLPEKIELKYSEIIK